MRGVFQNESLRPDKLRENALSRSTLPLGRATPTGLSRRRRCRIDRTQDRADRPPLRRRRWPKKWKSHQERAITQKVTKTHSPVTTRRGGAPLPSLHRLNGRLIYRPLLDVRRRPTRRRTCKQESTTIRQGSKGNFKTEYKVKEEIRCTLESVCARGTSSGSGGLL